MSTPILNATSDPIKTDTITPDNPFIQSKISQGRIYCQECFKAKGELIAVRLNFEGDRAVFSHDDCVLNPQIPKSSVEQDEDIKPFQVKDGLVYVPVTEEGWTYDPPQKVGDRCTIVTKYYHEWLYSKSEAKTRSYKIDSAYQSAAEWDSHSTLVVEKIDGDTAKVKSQSGKTRAIPLKVLWTLEKA